MTRRRPSCSTSFSIFTISLHLQHVDLFVSPRYVTSPRRPRLASSTQRLTGSLRHGTGELRTASNSASSDLDESCNCLGPAAAAATGFSLGEDRALLLIDPATVRSGRTPCRIGKTLGQGQTAFGTSYFYKRTPIKNQEAEAGTLLQTPALELASRLF
jgi:hypothetical protein